MTEDVIDEFKTLLRHSMIERLVLRRELLAPRTDGHLSIEDNLSGLRHWLDLTGADIAGMIGPALQNPALTALYAGAADDVAAEMKERADQIAAELLGSS